LTDEKPLYKISTYFLTDDHSFHRFYATMGFCVFVYLGTCFDFASR